MYLLNELLLSIPLAIYVCLRVRSLLPSKPLKNVWTAVFVALAAAYPVAETLSHRATDGGLGLLVLLGYYALPLLLYLILTVLVVDAAVGLLRLARIVSRETVRTPRFKSRRLIVSLVLPVLIVALGAVNHRLLRVKEYRVEIPRRSAAAQELTVVFMSDLHFRDLTSNRFLDELVEKVNRQNPDLILLGGDLLEGDRHGEDTTRYERVFHSLRARFGLLGASGNHEGFSHGGFDGFIERAGVRLLQDEAVPVDEALLVAGLRDPHREVGRPVGEVLAAAPRHDLPVILLAHQPLGFDAARAAGVDIQLSGHTHHGQLFPVNFITAWEYDLSWGHLERGGAHLFVTSGVQGWGPPVRTIGRSEILVLHLVLK